jgi:AAA domain
MVAQEPDTYQQLADGLDWPTDPQLRDRQYPDPEYLIDGILPANCFTLAVGAPKVGKTALSLPLALRLTHEGKRVLYIALDDSPRRLRSRSMMAEPQRHPDHARLQYLFGWNPADRTEAFGALNAWLSMARSMNIAYDLVVIDTYGRFVGRKKSTADIFGYDYETGQAFKTLCSTHSCSVLVNHHAKKSTGADGGDWLEMVSGTQGIAAAADAIWYITRTRNSRQGLWRITGNDMEEKEIPVVLGPDQVWREDLSVTPAQARHTGVPRDILDHMMAHPISSVGEIRDAIGADQNTVGVTLGRLRDEGVIEFFDGSWNLVINSPDNQLPTQGQIPNSIPAPQNTCPPSTPTEAPPNSQTSAPEPIVGTSIQAPKAQTFELDTTQLDPADPRKGAIKASMALMKASVQRQTARYKPSLYAAQPDEVKEVWEGRNKWSIPVPDGTPLVRLDKAAAYLSAVNTRLPVGPLTEDADPDDAYRSGRAGYHLVRIPAAELACGGPFHTRLEKGDVWITTPTLKQLLHVLPDTMIGRSFTGPATEVLLRPWADVLREKRAEAIRNDDGALYGFVKSCYSLPIATMGESSKNWEIRRPDWMHIIRAQAYALLWRKAMQAQKNGCLVVKVGNTDEIWLRDDIQVANNFKIGRGLGEWSVKDRWIAGEK